MAVWFRSWHGAPTDNKWLVVARRAKTTPGVVSAVFWALLDCASQAEYRGDISEFDIETYAEFSGFGDDVVTTVLNVMREKNVIDGRRLVNWDKRQPKREDDSTGRVRRHRAKKNVTDDDNATGENCNAMKRSVTHGNNTEERREEVDPETDNNAKNVEVEVGIDSKNKAVQQCYAENMPGKVTKVIAADLAAFVDEHGAEKVIAAINEAGRNGARNIKYVAKILNNWKNGDGAPNVNGKSPERISVPANVAELLR